MRLILKVFCSRQWFKEAERTKKPSLLLTLLKRHLYTLIWVFFASNIEVIPSNLLYDYQIEIYIIRFTCFDYQ